MIGPPVFVIASQDTGVQSVLGDSNGLRFYPFGKAPQNETRPYGVFQTVYGSPDNSLACIPKEDNWGVQIDCYAKSVTDARNVAEALRDAFEVTRNYVVSWNGEDWEQNTGLWRVSFTVEFWTTR